VVVLALLVISFVAFALDIWVVNAVLLKAFARVSPARFFRKIVPAQLVGSRPSRVQARCR